jgi:pyridoxamine 5'-phosphate oxidase family protein
MTTPDFSNAERAYLESQILGRLATVDSRGRPHVVPVGFRLDSDAGTIRIGGHGLATSWKMSHIRHNPAVAFVVDDLASLRPWHVRGVEIRGEARLHDTGGEVLGPGFDPTWIEIVPSRIRSWGLD